MDSILFICSTNLTRSPLAAAMLKHKLHSSEVSRNVFSAGAFPGTTPRGVDRRVLQVSPPHIASLLMEHTTSEFTVSQLKESQIIVMDEDSATQVRRLIKENNIQNSYTRFRSLFGDESLCEIGEPSQGEASFQEIYSQIQTGIDTFFQQLLNT